MRPLTRVQPAGPVQAYKTYSVSVPRATHTRPASCEEVGCAPYLNGWTTTLSLTTQAALVHTVRTSGRPFTEATDGDTVTFVFEPGTRCFKAPEHRVQFQPELYVVRGGDWRGNPTGMRRLHRNATEFVEDFGEHQQKIIDLYERG